MKKMTWISLALAVLLCVSLVACTREKADDLTPADTTESVEETTVETTETEAPKKDGAEGGGADGGGDKTGADKGDDALWADAIESAPTTDYDNDGNWAGPF